MDLSIIVPCHNLEPFVEKLLQSLKEQNLYQYEVEAIFICDSCTDKTQDIITNFDLPNFRKIKVYKAEVHSCGLARNIGIEAAEGRYIWFMDGDDWLMQDDAIARAIAILDDHNAPFLRIDYESTFPYHWMQMMVWQYIFRKDFIGDLRFLPIQPDEDVVFTNELFKDNPKGLFLHEKLYYYNYMREGSNMYQVAHKGFIES